MNSKTCTSCKGPLPARDGFVFCPQCGTPELIGGTDSAFRVLSVPMTFVLDEKQLENRYYELTKRLHPDRYAGAGTAMHLRSQHLSALLNQAYLSLRQPEARLETLLRSAGALKEQERSETQAQIPADLAEEYFEIQEALMENPASARGMIAAFRGKLEEKRQKLTAEIFELANRTDWSTDRTSDPQCLPESLIQKIVDLRRRRSYVRSMLENLAKLGSPHDR